MHGHGYTQPVKQPPSPGYLVSMRVLFVTLSVLTCGFLTWVMLLRLAVVTRRSVDWGLFVAVLAVDILSIVLIGTEPGDEIHTPGGYTGLALLLITLVAVIAYYIAADVRHFQQLRYGGYAPTPTPGYGYPQTSSPFTATTVPQTAPPQTAPPPPRQAPPPPARIDQVRAELDELSDYLRRHDGNGGAGPQGGT
ncbi:hypothetical protein ACGF3J_14000 [Streptomyces sp. NPDC048171]|uniref:hypothetical protein n=1 Tax=unclassified Streptomyces TaxID=2593676 RepID=UPI00136A0317|nr:hypothetical protein [Streptomyces sp. SID5789]MZE67916.1 hypothetical protein [Streptomyces sp. SID5789]